jgi:hypothetical protein
MGGLDLARFGGQSKGLGRELEQMRGLAEIEPWLVPMMFGRLVHRNAVMRPQGSDAFARPSIAMACDKAIPVEDAGDKVVIGDQHELPNCGNHIGWGAVALAAAASGQAHLAVDAADPVDHENDLGRLGVNIGHHFLDDGSHDAERVNDFETAGV